MRKIRVRRLGSESANVEQLKVARDWMDATFDRHAYMCFPMTLTNALGWGISFNKDVRAIWDGVDSSEDGHVSILEGDDIVHTGRSHASLSFKTGIIVSTDEDVSMLTMPVPNQFIRGIQTFTTLMSTSFYGGDFPIAMKILEPNREIVIPAGTPIATIVPISLSNLQNEFEMEITEGGMPREHWEKLEKYGNAAQEKNAVGDWSKMYRDAVDHEGNSMGKHEVKSLKLKTTVCPVTGMSADTEDIN
jgi:hypothetical protein